MTTELIEYIEDYNKISETEIKRKFGDKVLKTSEEN
jgi:hypothetical protein